jgi:hypothetical protein
VDAQAALTKANSSLPADRHINFRIGIHVAPVSVAKDEIGVVAGLPARSPG